MQRNCRQKTRSPRPLLPLPFPWIDSPLPPSQIAGATASSSSRPLLLTSPWEPRRCELVHLPWLPRSGRDNTMTSSRSQQWRPPHFPGRDGCAAHDRIQLHTATMTNEAATNPQFFAKLGCRPAQLPGACCLSRSPTTRIAVPSRRLLPRSTTSALQLRIDESTAPRLQPPMARSSGLLHEGTLFFDAICKTNFARWRLAEILGDC